MTFTAYIQRQKSLIRSRREGERVARREEIISGYETENIFGCDTEKLIDDLMLLKGLNTAERERYSRVSEYEYC